MPYPLKLLLLILLIGFGSKAAFSQPYNTALGIRGPFGKGVTIKHYIGEKSALEGIAALRYRGFLFTGLYERHAPAFDVEGFYWYYGGGGHLGTWNEVSSHPWYDGGSHVAIGVDGIVGLEYRIQPIPIHVGLDYKPAINLIGAPDRFFWFGAGGLSVRYEF